MPVCEGPVFPWEEVWQSWQRLGIAVSGLLCPYILWREKCKWVGSFAGVPFSWSLSSSSPLHPSPGTQRHSVTHPKLRPTFIGTHIHTHTDACTLTPTYLPPCAYTLWNTHRVLDTHSHMFTVFVCLTHTPCLSTWCQAICCLCSFPGFASSSCSFLAVPISF